MTAASTIELAIAAAMFVGALFLYRRRTAGPDSSYGSQGAVILFVLAAIIGIHALGLLEYHPSETEMQVIRGGRG